METYMSPGAVTEILYLFTLVGAAEIHLKGSEGMHEKMAVARREHA
jgi:hypothetical protein